MDWLLSGGDLRHERVNRLFIQRVFYGLSPQMDDNIHIWAAILCIWFSEIVLAAWGQWK